MLRRFTSALLALLLLGTLLAVAASTPRGGRRKCLMRGMPDCCKKMRAETASPEFSATPPCCAARRPQPAPPAQNFAFRHAPESTVSPGPHAACAQMPPTPARAPRAYSPTRPHTHSPPAYIQHLALLI